MKKAKFKLGTTVMWLNNPTSFPNNKIKGKVVGLETIITEYLDDTDKEVEYVYQLFDGVSSYHWIKEKHISKK